jgi:transposase
VNTGGGFADLSFMPAKRARRSDPRRALSRRAKKANTKRKARLESDLRSLVKRPSSPQALVQRARIVLLSVFEGLSETETAAALGIDVRSVKKWRKRFTADQSIASLKDRSRTGRPKRIDLRAEAVVITLGCQRPEESDRPEARMFHRVIAEEAAKRGVQVSRSSVQRILARAELQPHRERYYLFTPKDSPEYEARRDAICDLYQRKMPENEVVICFDEKSGMQVLAAPKFLRGRPSARGALPGGYPALIEHNYKRLGSRTLVAAIRPDTGECVVSRIFARRQYRTIEAVQLLRELLTALPHEVVHLVWDNGSTHISVEMTKFLASPEGSRLRVYYTPTHASWLNLAENFFSRLSRGYLGRRRYRTLEQFDAHVNSCIIRLNSEAHPIRWSYNPRRAA